MGKLLRFIKTKPKTSLILLVVLIVFWFIGREIGQREKDQKQIAQTQKENTKQKEKPIAKVGKQKVENESPLDKMPIPKGKITGDWIAYGIGVEPHRIIIYENSGLKLNTYYEDGSSGTTELEQDGNKYIYPNQFGEYYLITDNGELQIYDQDGQIASNKFIKTTEKQKKASE